MFIRIMVTGWLLVLSLSVTAADSQTAQLREHLADQYPNFEVDSIEPAPVDGLFEVISGSQIMYLTADGRYAFRGELLDLEAGENVTAEVQAQLSHEQVAELGEDNMIVYEPEDGEPEHTLTVFTDTSCPYCQRLHNDVMDMIDSDDIKIRYLMFPRAGLDSAAAEELANVWCADDPQAAMTAAKNGQEVPSRSDSCNAPVAEQFETGRAIGVSGTPYLLIEDGPVFSGYRSKEQLRQILAGERDPRS